MHVLLLVTFSMHTKLEVPSFTCFGDMVEAATFKNGSHDLDLAHLCGCLLSQG